MKVIGAAQTYIRYISSKTIEFIPNDILLVNFSDRIPPGISADKCIVVGRRLGPKRMISAMAEKGFRHILDPLDHEMESAIRSASVLAKHPHGFILNPLPHILEVVPLIPSLSLSLNCSSQKQKCLDEVLNYVAPLPDAVNLSENVRVIVDELLTNAIYNGPVDALGNPKFRSSDRTAEVKLGKDQFCKLLVARDERKLVISVEDPFGSLDEATMWLRLRSAYKTRKINVNLKGEGGAGIGLRLVLDRVSEFYVGVEKRKKTIFCCCLPLRPSAKLAETVLKSIHYVKI